ncbi:MAG: hypothetical protein OEW48_20940, partial [Phycisphaerae bacterium]|nr:hypothetical protein [Phycisphaerae bacterium]
MAILFGVVYLPYLGVNKARRRFERSIGVPVADGGSTENIYIKHGMLVIGQKKYAITKFPSGIKSETIEVFIGTIKSLLAERNAKIPPVSGRLRACTHNKSFEKSERHIQMTLLLELYFLILFVLKLLKMFKVIPGDAFSLEMPTG